MTTIEPGVVERVVEALARLDESRKGWEAGERIDGDEAVCILRLGTVRPIEEAARKVPSLLALLAQQQARIGEMEGALNEIGREQSATTAWAAADRFQLLARAALPCETKGVEDLEAGCCAPCRARAQLALATKEPT